MKNNMIVTLAFLALATVACKNGMDGSSVGESKKAQATQGVTLADSLAEYNKLWDTSQKNYNDLAILVRDIDTLVSQKNSPIARCADVKVDLFKNSTSNMKDIEEYTTLTYNDYFADSDSRFARFFEIDGEFFDLHQISKKVYLEYDAIEFQKNEFVKSSLESDKKVNTLQYLLKKREVVDSKILKYLELASSLLNDLKVSLDQCINETSEDIQKEIVRVNGLTPGDSLDIKSLLKKKNDLNSLQDRINNIGQDTPEVNADEPASALGSAIQSR